MGAERRTAAGRALVDAFHNGREGAYTEDEFAAVVLAIEAEARVTPDLDVELLVQAQVAVSQREFSSMTEKARAIAAEYARLREAPDGR